MRLDLRQVLLINRIRYICDGQQRHIHIGYDAVQRTRDSTADIGSQFTIDG